MLVPERELYLPPINDANRTCAAPVDPSPLIAAWDTIKAAGQRILMQFSLDQGAAHLDCRAKLAATWADIDAGKAALAEANAKAKAEAAKTVSDTTKPE